ncbi:hypothetical protein [Nocardia fluminea]|uniref:hypothetical protein n=1 Tax=Nocardia fluminea TaxID=134984 RepID=UPI00342B8E60
MDQTSTVKRTAIGYRLDGIRNDGRIGFYGAPDADPVRCPRLRDRPRLPNRPQREEHGRWTPAAFCISHPHISPAVDCVCGWRVTTDMFDLVDLPDGPGLDVTMQRNDNIGRRPVVVKVSSWGPTLPPIPGEDPDTTVRTTWMRLEERIWIDKDVHREAVRKARRWYPWARIERFGDLLDLAEALEDELPDDEAL